LQKQKIGTRGVRKALQFCYHFYNARKMEAYRPKCTITKHNIMKNIFFECKFCLITVNFKVNLLQLLNGFVTA
jgi:hypothetical protein